MALLKHVDPTQLPGRADEGLFHAGRVDVGMVDSPRQQGHGSRHYRRGNTSTTQGTAASMQS